MLLRRTILGTCLYHPSTKLSKQVLGFTACKSTTASSGLRVDYELQSS